MNQNEMLRIWLAQACGVGSMQVTDEHLREWHALRMKIRAYQPTEAGARKARSNARALGVHVEGDR